MSRKSYGADVFSPVTSNASFNNDFNNSDSFELWQEPCGGTGSKLNSQAKQKISGNASLCKDEASSLDKIPDNSQPVTKSKSATGKKKKKSLPSETDAKRFSYITTRNKGFHRSREELSVIQENQSNHNATISKTRKKKCVTVKSENDSNKEFMPNKSKQNKESSSAMAIFSDSNKELSSGEIKKNKNSTSASAISADPNEELLASKIKKNLNLLSLAPTDFNKELFPSKIAQSKESFSLYLAKEQPNKSLDFNLHIDSIKSDSDYPGSSDKQAQTQEVNSKSMVILKKSQSENKKLEKISKVSTKKNTQIEKPAELSLDKENQGESVIRENSNKECAPVSSLSKPEENQADIEKLVKDAVSFEFDGIRQMLYLHQLQLLRCMDRNVKTIEELVEENRRLKNIIATQKNLGLCFTEDK